MVLYVKTVGGLVGGKTDSKDYFAQSKNADSVIH
jgi:hypothetical protein